MANDLKQAKTAFDTLCQMMDEKNWKYDKDEEKLTIETVAQGDDLPISLRVIVDADRQLVLLLSEMPYNIAADKRDAIAIAVSSANYGMVDGNFDFDYTTGKILFRLTSSYMNSLVGKEMFEYMLFCACYTIDAYNDKFLVVAKRDMTVAEILEYVK